MYLTKNFSYSFDNCFRSIGVLLYQNSDNYSAIFGDRLEQSLLLKLRHQNGLFFPLVFSLETRHVHLCVCFWKRNVATWLPKYGSTKCQINFPVIQVIYKGILWNNCPLIFKPLYNLRSTFVHLSLINLHPYVKAFCNEQETFSVPLICYMAVYLQLNDIWP